MNWEDLIKFPRQPMRRSLQYGFPQRTLAPGEQCRDAVEVKGLFRAQKLIMAATMREIRWRFKIKRSRLPWLETGEGRPDVVAHTRIRRWRNKSGGGFVPVKVVVAHSGSAEVKPFVREYLPSSVVYQSTDPLEYVALLSVSVGAHAQMPSFEIPAQAFVFGNSLRMDTAEDVEMSIRYKNTGDVPVKVSAVMLGVGL